MPRVCHFCGKEIEVTGKIQFREECPHCRGDLHICLNCRDFDEAAYHQCREPQAEFVSMKEKSNRCEYFTFRESASGRDRAPKGGRSAAEEMWKKMVKK